MATSFYPSHLVTPMWSERVLGVLRIVAGFMFMMHGMAKILHMPFQPQYATLSLFSLIGVAGLLELVGGAMVMLGFFTRPAAFILSGEMAFAYFMAHAPRALLPLQNQGDAAVLYCFVFLYLAFAGPGAWSLDGLRRRASDGVLAAP